MTTDEIKNEIIFKQELYIEYLVHAVKQESILRDITLGVRESREREISELKTQLIKML